MSAEDHHKKELLIAHELAAQLGKRIERLTKENDKLRGILAESKEPCIYCGLSRDNMNMCLSGFPGCARADDLMVYESMKDQKDGQG